MPCLFFSLGVLSYVYWPLGFSFCGFPAYVILFPIGSNDGCFGGKILILFSAPAAHECPMRFGFTI